MRWKLILFFLIILQVGYGQFDVSIEKEVYSIGETLQLKILLEELPIREISNDDIYLYKEGIIKVSSFLFKLNDKEYYAYFDVPNIEEGNYSIKVKLLYNIDGRLQEVVKSKDVILEGKGLSIRPGLIKLDGEDFFKINLNNKGDEVTVEVEKSEFFSFSKDKINIPNNQNRILYVYPKYDLLRDNGEIILNYNNFSFKIPILTKEEEKINETEYLDGIEALTFVTKEDILEKEVFNDQTVEGVIKLKNNLNKSLFDLEFGLTNSLSEIIKLNSSKIKEIKAGEELSQYIWINKNKDIEKGIYEGEIYVKSKEGYKTSFPVSIKVSEKEYSNEEYDYEEEEEGVGVIEEEENFPSDFGLFDEENKTKEVTTKESTGGKWIVIILIILFMVFGLWFVYSKTKPKKDFKDIIKERTK